MRPPFLLHPSSWFLITSISADIFFPPKREKLLISMQSRGTTNSTLLFFRSMKMKYSWLWRAFFEQERWGWRREVVILTRAVIQISMVSAPHFSKAALFLHMLAIWTWRTDRKKISCLISPLFQTVCLLTFSFSVSSPSLLLYFRCSSNGCHISTVGNISMAVSD